VETYAVFTDTERGLLTKNKMMEIAKSGASDAQDDFRLSKYDLSEGHVKEHIKKELYGTKEDLSETERQIVLSEYLDSSEKDILSLSDKSGISVYSSMEECALKGAYPCKACVLGLYK